MSGVEILGLAASVIQIAELGGKLSVQLFTFTRKVKNANKSIDALSQELASTGAVLKQLGETLTKDDQLRVCSQEAIATARGLVEDTNRVFTSLSKIILGDEKSNENFLKGISLKQRLKFPFLETQIEQVQANLERLKSSLLVILNVLVFAEQLRNREALPILKDQRELIKVLANEKEENERRYKRILAAIADKPSDSGSKRFVDPSTSPVGSVATTFTTSSTTATLVNPVPDPPETKSIVVPIIVLPTGLQRHHERIHHHSYLVQNLLSEIASLQYNLDLNTRDRMQNGILNMHWDEWSMYRLRHGHEHFEKMLSAHPDVASYWTDRVQDIFSRQFEAAQAVRQQYSQVPSVSSATPSPEAQTPVASPQIPKTETVPVQKDLYHSSSVSDAVGDDYDTEAAFGLAAMAALDKQELTSKGPAITETAQTLHVQGSTPSQFRGDGEKRPKANASSIENDGKVMDRPPGTDTTSKSNSGAVVTTERASRIVPLRDDQEASQVDHVIALYNFEPDENDREMLPFKIGDKIQVLQSVYRQWWRGSCNGKVGMFPTNYVGVRISIEEQGSPGHYPRTSNSSQPPSTAQPATSQAHSQRVNSSDHRKFNPDALPVHAEAENVLHELPSQISSQTMPHGHQTQVTATENLGSSLQGSPPPHSVQLPSIADAYFTKVRIRYISPEVLEWEKLPWLYDPIDKDYLVVKRTLKKPELDQLSQQTRVLRVTRNDKVNGNDLSSETDGSSRKLKDSFHVVPAALHSRLNGKLEYETLDSKKGDERNPLFVKFELDGTKKGLLSKAKKKSVFYKVVNIQIASATILNQQQTPIHQRPMPQNNGTSMSEESSSLSLSADTGEKKNSLSKLMARKPAEGKTPITTMESVEGNASVGLTAREKMAARLRWQSSETQEPTYNYDPGSTLSSPSTAQGSSYSNAPHIPFQYAAHATMNSNSEAVSSPTSLRYSKPTWNAPYPMGPPFDEHPAHQIPTTTSPTQAYQRPKMTMADRSKYQFEADSDDEELNAEIDQGIEQLGGATKRLNLLAKAMGAEVDAQNNTLQRIMDKSDRVDDVIALNRPRLNRIDGPAKLTAQKSGSSHATYQPLSYGGSASSVIQASDNSLKTKISEAAERRARQRELEQRRTRAMLLEDEKERDQELLRIYEEIQSLDGAVVVQEYIPEAETGSTFQPPKPPISTREDDSMPKSSCQAVQGGLIKDHAKLNSLGTEPTHTPAEAPTRRTSNHLPAQPAVFDDDALYYNNFDFDTDIFKSKLVGDQSLQHYSPPSVHPSTSDTANFGVSDDDSDSDSEIIIQSRNSATAGDKTDVTKGELPTVSVDQSSPPCSSSSIRSKQKGIIQGPSHGPSQLAQDQLDEIDHLILRFSALDEGEYRVGYKYAV